MQVITPEQKVADVLADHPETYEVFQRHGCPDMRKGFFSYMARIMNIRNAARIHRIPIDQLMNELNATAEEKAGH